MSQIRTIIAIILTIITIFCLYYQYVKFLYFLINVAVSYDAYYLHYRHYLKYIHVFLFLLLMYSFNYYLLYLYYVNPLSVIKIIAITQTSDIYQYFTGSKCGINKIGWISQNKTYEGYIFGFIATLFTFLSIYLLLFMYAIIEINFVQAFYEITMVYFLGVISGLLSSLFKRLERIKDYSDMLGPHGGWVDRIDSIILPSFFVFLIF